MGGFSPTLLGMLLNDDVLGRNELSVSATYVSFVDDLSYVHGMKGYSIFLYCVHDIHPLLNQLRRGPASVSNFSLDITQLQNSFFYMHKLQ